jgi:hypothetical protein
MAKLGKDVYIIIGPPLSDWKCLMVKMTRKEDAPEVIQPGGFVYLTGTLPLHIEFKSKSIPYKYIVMDSNCRATWESIHHSTLKEGEVNRCLVVPDRTETRFFKFDDVILPKDTQTPSFLQQKGREMATKWMLPRPKNFRSSTFDFEQIWGRFELVIKTHGPNGTKLCIGDDPNGYFNPYNYNVDSTAKNLLNNFFKAFGQSVQDKKDNKEILLRMVIFFCLAAAKTKFFSLNMRDQYLALFDIFWRNKDLIPGHLPESIHGEIQIKIVESLKKIVQDFVDLPINVWSAAELTDSGNWIFVMPFIHRWDRSRGETDTWCQYNETIFIPD